jgi:hypothetical protein
VTTRRLTKAFPELISFWHRQRLQPLLSSHGKELVTYAIRQALDHFRQQIQRKISPSDPKVIIEKVTNLVQSYGGRNLKKVINASGVIIHTNLGRAPFSHEMLRILLKCFRVIITWSLILKPEPGAAATTTLHPFSNF